MKKVFAMVSHNLGLKLLALVLALVIFYSVRGSLQRRSGEAPGFSPISYEGANTNDPSIR